jgi:hypothetical protein
MSEYTPDRWVIVEINSDEHGKIRKVLASWYGGFAGADEWRMNSGIEKVIDQGTYYDVYGYSGSIYKCAKGAEGMSAYTSGIYESYKKQLEESNMGTMEIVNILEGSEIHSDKGYEVGTLEDTEAFARKRNGKSY